MTPTAPAAHVVLARTLRGGRPAGGLPAQPRARSLFGALALTALTLLGCCNAEPDPRRGVVGVAPAALAAEAMTLLPRAAVPAPPDAPHLPGALATRAYDRAFVSPHLAAGRSYSIGTTRDGYLVGGVPLNDGPGLAVRPISIRRRAIHGTHSLVDTLARAATAVARRWPGSVLYAGDLSAPEGGDLPNHVSHNSGRDADLAFYLRAPDGAFADSPDMRIVGADLRTSSGHRFDTVRNWALVEALLRDPIVDVQYLFIANHLRAALLEHARSVAADEALVARAEATLVEPRRGSPHAEHFHLRVYCRLEERLEGCLDGAPFHPWARRHDAELRRWVDGLLPFLTPAHGDEAEWAITRLVRMNATDALPALRALSAAAADPHIAALAHDAVAFLSGGRSPAAWRHWRPPDDLLED